MTTRTTILTRKKKPKIRTCTSVELAAQVKKRKQRMPHLPIFQPSMPQYLYYTQILLYTYRYTSQSENSVCHTFQCFSTVSALVSLLHTDTMQRTQPSVPWYLYYTQILLTIPHLPIFLNRQCPSIFTTHRYYIEDSKASAQYIYIKPQSIYIYKASITILEGAACAIFQNSN